MATADPTAKKASDATSGISPQKKIDGVLDLISHHKTGMLTSRAPDGKLASRAMIPATTEGLVFSFFFNIESGKTSDLESSPEVNISYLDPKSGDWASISGKAVINQDKTKVKKHWSSALKAWFDDKKDGKHTGDENDPRVALIDVHPEEIRFFKADGKLQFLYETAKAAVSGEAASGGKLLIITEDELKLAGKVAKS